MPTPPPLVTVSYFGEKSDSIRRRPKFGKNNSKTLANEIDFEQRLILFGSVIL